MPTAIFFQDAQLSKQLQIELAELQCRLETTDPIAGLIEDFKKACKRFKVYKIDLVSHCTAENQKRAVRLEFSYGRSKTIVEGLARSHWQLDEAKLFQHFPAQTLLSITFLTKLRDISKNRHVQWDAMLAALDKAKIERINGNRKGVPKVPFYIRRDIGKAGADLFPHPSPSPPMSTLDSKVDTRLRKRQKTHAEQSGSTLAAPNELEELDVCRGGPDVKPHHGHSSSSDSLSLLDDGPASETEYEPPEPPSPRNNEAEQLSQMEWTRNTFMDEESFQSGGITPTGDYGQPYPDMDEKTVEPTLLSATMDRDQLLEVKEISREPSSHHQDQGQHDGSSHIHPPQSQDAQSKQTLQSPAESEHDQGNVVGNAPKQTPAYESKPPSNAFSEYSPDLESSRKVIRRLWPSEWLDFGDIWTVLRAFVNDTVLRNRLHDVGTVPPPAMDGPRSTSDPSGSMFRHQWLPPKHKRPAPSEALCVPINLREREHWVLLLLDFSENQARVLDSMLRTSDPSKDQMEHIARAIVCSYGKEWDGWTLIRDYTYMQQDNNDDCAIAVLISCLSILAHRSPPPALNGTGWRRLLQYVMDDSGSLTQFEMPPLEVIPQPSERVSVRVARIEQFLNLANHRFEGLQDGIHAIDQLDLICIGLERCLVDKSDTDEKKKYVEMAEKQLEANKSFTGSMRSAILSACSHQVTQAKNIYDQAKRQEERLEAVKKRVAGFARLVSAEVVDVEERIKILTGKIEGIKGIVLV